MAAGQPLPDVDLAAQWPEGIRPARELTLLGEWGMAAAYRCAKGLGLAFPFHRFAILYVSLLTSLAIAVVYLVVRLAGGSRAGGLLGAVLFAFAGAHFDRVRWMESEYFGLLPLFLAIAAMGAALRVRAKYASHRA